MVAEAEVVCHQSVPVSDVPFFVKGSNIEEIDETLAIRSPKFGQVRVAESDDAKSVENVPDPCAESTILQFLPCIRSSSFADIGPRRYMEDEHIRIDNLSSHLGSIFKFPKPNAFYGVFDGHGGPEAAAYVRKHALRFFFEDVKFPQTCEVDDVFLEGVENSLRKSFLLADLALAGDCTVNSSSGTTALTALIFGRLLMVANAGDCRAVLCRKGDAIDMSEDHRPIYPSERRRVEELGGFIDDGYLNGVLSVSRALGDWDMKSPKGLPSPLIAEPDEHAVSLVRRGLRRHDDPEQCAKDLVMEALRRNTFDNLTVIVICFSAPDSREQPSPRQRRLKCCSLSAEALCSLRSLLDGNANW
ncbi:hypothetical protein GOBAR_AA05623 [Gossypium barbadense]|uniref:protein-serine/threonine phosphatase n=1 Tax=Gossypium barbadense TaxID=3634 RepID=A0A2P5YH86_GOSBA|nr:hypothetical protein GOBAR_AA05623 [Gossypium barbadense]